MSSDEGAAVPIGICLNICRESAEIISECMRFASSIANADFPEAVGPVITMRVFNFVSQQASQSLRSLVRLFPTTEQEGIHIYRGN